jgi:eukaryotic-like serine/threonine-protein kinase
MLDAGTKLGPYEVISPLGAGGMGEVYLARDTRLGREVAIKVLPQHLSENAEVRARFEREARTVSSLNHPNICTLFDVGREGETDYLVMERIEGETLAERLRKGALATPELVRLGAQIADALDRAHRAGVVHRDLKPANVMITRGGAKLMDFGLARATGVGGPAGGSSVTMAALSQSPTVAHALTAEGSIVGTFQYMSPEQLEGKEADARSDIWALGCVLHEMATGRRAFEGRSQASLIAAILEREPAGLSDAPSGSSAPGGRPVGLDRLIRACLAKDAEERIQTAHDVKLQLQWIAEGAGLSSLGVATPAPPVAHAGATRTGARLAWAVAAIALAGTAGFLAWAWPRLSAHAPVFRFNPDTNLPGIVDAFWPRVSPDGRSLVFDAVDSAGTSRAWLLRLDETKAHPIPGSEGLQRAYWSPTGREIVFVADGKIQRLLAAGGTPTIVCPAPGGADLSWGAKGEILLDGATTDSLRMVPAGGGELRPATRISRKDHEVGSAWPHFLPDGDRFLFIGIRSDGTAGNIRLGRLGSLESKLLGQSDGRVEYAPGGWVLYVRGAALIAQKLDLGAAKLTGQPITIVDDLRTGNSSGHFSISPSGVLAIARSSVESGLELHIADRKGVLQPAVIAKGTLGNPRFSPDGRRVLYERKGPSGTPFGDIGVYDLDRGTDTRLTFTDGWAVQPHWSPDGRRFAFTRVGRSGPSRLVIGSSDGLGAQDSLAAPSGTVYLSQWAEAGSRLIAYTEDTRLLAAPAEGDDRTLRPLLDPALVMGNPQVSPDGRWLAGTMGTNPNYNVYVQSLVGPPGRWQISTAPGGYKASWTRGGAELVFEGSDSRLMAVDIDTKTGFHAGTPHPLFPLPLGSFTREVATWSPDASGERFLLVTPERTRTGSKSLEVMSDFSSLVNRK